MKSNYNVTHYETSFLVKGRDAWGSVGILKNSIWGWIKQKEGGEHKIFQNEPMTYIKDRSYTGRDLFLRGKFRPKKIIGLNCRICTTAFRDDPRAYWGMQYHEDDEDACILTDVGISYPVSDLEEQTVVFSIKISYYPKNARHAHFEPMRPRLIRFISESGLNIDTQGAPCYYQSSTVDDLVDDADGRALGEYLFSLERKAPVFVAIMNPMTPEAQARNIRKSLNNLALILFGKAMVFLVSQETEAWRTLNESISRHSHLCRANIGGLYLYHPRLENEGDIAAESYDLCELEQHDPKFVQNQDHQDVTYPLYTLLLTHVFRQHPRSENGAVLFDEICEIKRNAYEARKAAKEDALRKLQHEEESAKLLAENEQNHERRQKAECELQEIRIKLDKAKKDFDKAVDLARSQVRAETEKEYAVYFDDEISSLKRNVDELRRDNQLKDIKISGMGNDRFESALAVLRNMKVASGSVAENVRAIEPVFSDAIVISDKAYDDLQERNNPITFEIFLDFLYALRMRLLNAYQNPGSVCGWIDSCLSDLRVNYSVNESQTTMSNEKFRKDRTVVYKGVKYLCEAHLKHNSNDCRAYVRYLEDERKILIGRLGKHLDNAATRRLGR